jgi:hypothetical protein
MALAESSKADGEVTLVSEEGRGVGESWGKDVR